MLDDTFVTVEVGAVGHSHSSKLCIDNDEGPRSSIKSSH